MELKDLLKREAYVAWYGQSHTFRIFKWIIFVTLAVALYKWKGIATLGTVFVVLLVIAIAVHLLFRWKTEGWTKPWGLYKKALLDKQ